MNQEIANTHIATVNGHSALCNESNYVEVCNSLIAQHGPGVPVVRELADSPRVDKTELAPQLLAKAPVGNMPAKNSVQVTVEDRKTPVPEAPKTDLDSSGVSASGKDRAAADEALAKANGFNPADPVYSLGRRVNSWGVDNARKSQLDHAAKPAVQDMCDDIVTKVTAEQRNDLPPIKMSELQMTASGKLVLPGIFDGARMPLNRKALWGLLGRMPEGARKGARYLSEGCWPELRAVNFNRWAKRMQETEFSKTAVLRTRLNDAGGRFAFATVSERYAAFDTDKIARAIKLALGDDQDVRGSVDYDGERMRMEGLWHSDVAPEEYVAGEIFKAGFVVRTDDTGGGSIRVQSVIWRNLCLNLIILDQSIGVDVSLVHFGDVEELAAEFRAGFSQALNSVDGFRKQWSKAMSERDDVLKGRAQGTTDVDLGPLPIEAVLPGLFTNIAKRDLVPVTVKAVPKLMEMHRQDEAAGQYGVSRASIVNALTRYAHQVEEDPFKADLIREGAGKLLASTRPIGYETPAAL